MAIHPFIHSVSQSVRQSFIHPFIHSSIHPFIHPFIHSSIHSFIQNAITNHLKKETNASRTPRSRPSRFLHIAVRPARGGRKFSFPDSAKRGQSETEKISIMK